MSRTLSVHRSFVAIVWRANARGYDWRYGCFFYGALTAKVLLVHGRRLPGWALPAAGGMLAIIVGVLWYNSALWYYNGYQLPHL